MALYTIPIWLPLLLVFPLLLVMVKKKENKRFPPGPPKLPIIGNLHQVGELPHQILWKLSKTYGPIMRIQLGGKPALVISSAEAAREVLKIHDLDCCSRPASAGARRLSYNYLDTAFSPYSHYWRDMRKLCALELYSVKRVQSYQFVRDEEVALLIDSISRFCSPATPVDLSEKLYALTASIIFRISFGKNFRGSDLDNEGFQHLLHEIDVFVGSFGVAEFFPYVGWVVDRLSGRLRRLERIFHELDNFFQQVVDIHLNPDRTKEEHEDIVDVMLRMEREHAEAGFAKDNIKAVLLNIFLGGIDTGAVTMVWTMTEIVRNPRVMKKAQDEVRNLVGNKGKVTEGDLDQLPYLKMVIKEALRLHPPAPLLIPRETISHFKINGYDVFPKTLLQVNAWAIGRDPKCWKNPEEFIPERFSDSSIDFKGQDFKYLPFGSGRRGCPGISLAIATIDLALANLLYCFDWKLPHGMKEEDINMEDLGDVRLTVGKRTPLILVPVKMF